ncbi:N-methylhydantoinase A [hydrothermal vent metagenome]|uniref:N-methylhydantoinase A n=1 Tax=hydrothermal vent metagenome TaxID=652676 RepID=A0A3B0YGU9_9ZZZZ
MLLGVDTGGTFTDFVCFDRGRLRIHKVLSTPEAPELAILQGIRALGLDGKSFHLVHGSTVATNAALENKGVRTVYITNHGLADVLTIGRQARAALYQLQPGPQHIPVPAELCLETGGRLGADGSIVEPLDEAECRSLARRVAALKPQAVAINLLFSWLDDRFEKMILHALPKQLFTSCSSEILPEIREYERGMATWLNAWLGPKVEGYLQRLEQAVRPSPVHVMQSSGLTIRADRAAQRAVNLLLSGPAGGLMGAQHVAARHGITRLLTFDMGGTSTDVALVDGQINLTSQGRIGPYPVAVPMVDMHTIGAGGGSVSRLDEGGMLRVGPESAGADPGPACYGRGGSRATVTDANLVLGRLRPDAFLGGEMSLDPKAAQQVISALAGQMGVSLQQAAHGVIDLANEHMAQALRVISVQRGINPAGFSLVAFGGAGGLHVCALADALGMHQAMVPAAAGVLSALGMLVAPRGRQMSRTLRGLLSEQNDVGLQTAFQRLVDQGLGELREEGVQDAAVDSTYSLDLRYAGQSFSLTIPFESVAGAGEAFHEAHQLRFGHRLDVAVEVVNLRVALSTAGEPLRIQKDDVSGSGEPVELARLEGLSSMVPVWRPSDLICGQVYIGPLLIVDEVATVFAEPGWCLRKEADGSLLLTKKSAGPCGTAEMTG